MDDRVPICRRRKAMGSRFEKIEREHEIFALFLLWLFLPVLIVAEILGWIVRLITSVFRKK